MHHQEIVFGDAHELAAATDEIVLDHFEYDQTSVHRITHRVAASCVAMASVAAVYVCRRKCI